jgi:hypothetical protein
MKKTLRRHKPGYALSFLLWFLGSAAFFTVLWKTWPQASSAENPLSVFWASLWTQKLQIVSGIEFELVYLLVTAIAMFAVGLIVFALSREWLLLAGKNVWLECPFCKKRWRTSPEKALVLCPYCRQLVHPRLVDK